jgi:hypothetical protein
MKTALQDKQLRREINLIDAILVGVIVLCLVTLELLGYFSGVTIL